MRKIIACGSLAFVAVAAHAQVEPGWAVYSRLFNVVNPTAAAIPGGLVLYHPYLGMNAYVTNLPPALTGDGLTVTGGANAVLVRDDDGSLLASAIYRDAPAEIYDITVDGTVGTVRRTYPIGGAVPFSAIDQMVWLPGNRVLFSHRSVDNPALEPTTGLGILDLATGDVAAVPIADFPVGRNINSCAVDPGLTTIYIGTFGGGGGIYAVPFGGGAAVAVPGYETFPSAIQQLAVDQDGTIFVAPGSFIGAVFKIDPTTGDTETVADTGGTTNGLAIEPVTGDILFMRINANLGISAAFYWNSAAGRVEVPGMSGHESPSGIAVRSSLLPFGDADPRSSHEWQIRPNPGGAPRIGNPGFSLTTESTGRSHGLMLIATAPLAAPIETRLASNLLLDPTTTIHVFPLLPPASSFTVNVPLPAGMSGGDLYAQVLTLSRRAPPLAGGEGLRVHVYD